MADNAFRYPSKERNYAWLRMSSKILLNFPALFSRLGAVHDGSPPPSYLGGPGARKCRWEDGFIMSDLRHTSKGFRWSHCTIKQFHHFLKYGYKVSEIYRPGQPNLEYIMRKFKDFSVTQISHEINFVHFEAPKTTILTIWAALNFDFLKNFTLGKNRLSNWQFFGKQND